MEHLKDEEISAALSSLPGWTRQGDTITKQFACRTFADAVAALVRLAFDAEAADHHPDVVINYRKVQLTYCTHSEGALTRKDVEGARSAERIFSSVAG